MGGIGRETALDGLRGWAAVAVCCFHFLAEVFKGPFPQYRDSQLLMTFFNGGFAVVLFFVLSGYVLTYAAWRAPKGPVKRQLLKRYFRLMIPILGTSIVVFLMMLLGLTWHEEALPIVGGEHWASLTVFEPTIANLLEFSLYTVFTGRALVVYQPFLWTMGFELIGSYVVLLICLFERGGRVVYAVLGGLTIALLFLWTIGATFPLGALLALLKRDGLLPDIGRFAWPAAIAALFGANYIPGVWAQVLAGGLMVFAAVSTGGVNAALSSPVSNWVGSHSFPIYLMQWPVLISISCLGILIASGNGWLNEWTAIVIAIVSLAATFVAAWAFQPVEVLAQKAPNWIFFRQRAAAGS